MTVAASTDLWRYALAEWSTPEDEGDWEPWLRSLFPAEVKHAFAPHHEQFWEWVWSIEAGVRPDPFCAVWPRGGGKSSSAEMGVAALGARRVRRYGLYISATQDQADDHVSNVAGLLESDRLADRYPDMATRMVGKYGASKGWRRNRLRTSSGFSVDAMGLDSAARGVKLEDARPDFMVLDDLDKETDSPAATERKIKTLTRGVLPASSADCAILAIQNLVHENSVFARLVDGRADFLASRTVSGPVKALDAMAHEQVGGRTVIVAGSPTWAGQSLARCQEQVDDWGITAFLGEAQHDVTAPPGGMFDHLSFAHCAPNAVPDLVRTVVWVDPAVTDKDTSDAHGIQADGIAADGTIYRLRSWEARTSPRDALRRAITIAIEVGADHVGVETDQGGDTWTSVYREAAQDVLDERVDEGMMEAAIPPFTSDKAGAGYGPKVHRASKMLADYERKTKTGRPAIVHVLGDHAILEGALRRFPKTKPLDLVDTSFWSWTDLRNRRRGPIQSDYSGLRGRR